MHEKPIEKDSIDKIIIVGALKIMSFFNMKK